MNIEFVAQLRYVIKMAGGIPVGNNVTLDTNIKGNNNLNESTNGGTEGQTVHDKKGEIHDVSRLKNDDVRIDIAMEGEVHDVHGDIPLHRKSYAEIVQFGKSNVVNL